MLTLLCTAPSSAVISPVEGTSFLPPPPPPPASAGPSSSSSSSSPITPATTSGTSTGIGAGISRKLSIRRPSIRKRIQSLSRTSGTSIDSGKATLGNGNGGGVSAASGGKSPFSFFRHTSASASVSASAPSGSSGGHANAAASGSGSGPAHAHAHVRGASTSSFVSGKSSKSSSSSSSGGGIRLNVLNIGPPSAFRHQLHAGLEYTNQKTSDRDHDARDNETRLHQDDLDDMVVIDVVPATAIEPRTSTSSERYAVSHGHSRSASSASAVASSPNLLSFATTVGTSGTPKQQKRASLVKRKPVPKIDLEDLVESPPPRAVSPVPPNPTFVLVPDPVPAPGQDGEKGVEGGAEVASASAPPGKTHFEVPNPNVENESEETESKTVDISTVKANEDANPNTLVPPAPEHICLFHAAQLGPAPTPPPRRRHTLAHMQARALGRSGTVPGGPRPLCNMERVRVPTEEVMKDETREKEKKARQRPKPRPRPVPIVAPSPGPMQNPVPPSLSPSPSPVAPLVPPGLVSEEKANTEEKTKKETEQTEVPRAPNNAMVSADNSPRPSLSSLAPSSESDGSAQSSGSSADSGDNDMELRTPMDERRASAGSATYVKGSRLSNNSVRIVLPGEFPISEAEEDNGGERLEELKTPKMLRRTSKRPNPPARRVQAKEESVYVTADEADDV